MRIFCLINLLINCYCSNDDNLLKSMISKTENAMMI